MAISGDGERDPEPRRGSITQSLGTVLTEMVFPDTGVHAAMMDPLLSSFGFDLPVDLWLGRVREAVLTPPPSGLDQCFQGENDFSSHFPVTATLSVNPMPRERIRWGHGAIPAQPEKTRPANERFEHIGRYRILRLLGRGGMGTVFEAEQPHPRRVIALKIMRPGATGTGALRRFELEAQFLGRLQHPGIAQIHEAGVAETPDGAQPFFAMELINGDTLGRHAAAHRLGLRPRLELMARIADAVHYAHERGVIHRDLKPGNILVDASGQPKILDFGVARATDCDVQATSMGTDVGQIIGTLQYMSPEQVSGDPNQLDTRSDIFALGVILYELLADRVPYELKGKMIHEAARIIRDEEPTRLSSFNRRLGGDIETIVGKAMAKDKSLRYASASEFAEDIRRFLRDEPILARPPSAAYQLRKFARRNRILVGGVIAVFLALTAGLIASSVLYAQSEGRRRDAEVQRQRAADNERRADAEARAARTEAAKARTIQRFLQEMLAEADPRRTKRGEITMREVLDTASERLETQFAGEPEIKAAVEKTMGEAYYGLMDFEPAITHLSAAAALFRNLDQTDNADFADLLHKLGESYSYLGTGDGVPIMREALDLQVARHGDQHPKTAVARQYLGYALFRAGLAEGGNEAKFREAETLGLEALESLRVHPEATEEQVARCLHMLAVVVGFLGREDEAIAGLRDVLDIERRVFGTHPHTWDCIDDLAMFQIRAKRFTEALETLRELVSMGFELFGDADDKVADRLYQLNQLCVQVRDPACAEAAFDQAMQLWRRRNETVSEGAMKLRAAYALSLARSGDDVRARLILDQAVEEFRAGVNVTGNSSATRVQAITRIAEALIQIGSAATAVELLRELVDELTLARGADDSVTLDARFELARALRQSGKTAECAALFRDGWETQTAARGPADRKTLMWMGYYAGCLRDAGRFEEAERVFRQRYELRVEAGATEDVSYSATDMALVLRDLRRTEEALPFAREAYDIRSRIRGKNGGKTIEAESFLVEILTELGHVDEAMAILRDRYESWVAIGRIADEEAYRFGKLLRETDRTDEAAQVFKAGWQALRGEDGSYPVSALRWMVQYATCLTDLNRAVEADEMRREIAEVEIPTEGSEAQGVFEVAVAARRQGHPEEAAILFHNGWQARRLSDGTTPIEGLVWMGNYAATLMDLGRVEEAEPLFREAYERYKLHDPVSGDTSRAAMDMSIALHKLGATESAIPFALECVTIRRGLYPDGDERIRNSIQWLIDLLEQADRSEEATHWREQIPSPGGE